MKTPAPPKKPLVSTKFKVVATLITLGVIACIVSITRVMTAAFTSVEFSRAEAIVERARQRFVGKIE